MDLTEAVARHDEQIKTLTEQQNTIKGLTESTHSLALSIQKLADRIANQEERMDAIEESAEHYTRQRILWFIRCDGESHSGIVSECFFGHCDGGRCIGK